MQDGLGGLIDEWHLDFIKPIDHIEFDLLSRLRQLVVVFWLSFHQMSSRSIARQIMTRKSERLGHRLTRAICKVSLV